MIVLTILWSLLALTVIGLALYRKVAVAPCEDDLIHVGSGEEKLIPQQIAVAAKLDVIDKWGKILTAVVLVAGLLIASAYLYQAWLASQTLG
jgi:hypothetical protein